MKKRTLAAIGIASLLLFTIALAPATLLRLLPLQATGIELGRLSGSLWNGNAAYISAQGHRLQAVNWSLNPTSLLTAKVGLTLDARYLDRPLVSVVELGIDQTLYLHDTRISIPASKVNEMSLLPLGEIDGDIAIDIEDAELAAESVPLVRGVIYWKEASVTVAETARLGNVQITLDGIDDDMLVTVLNNQGGDIDISGDAEIQPGGDYVLDIRLLAGNGASNNVKNSLKMFAKPQADGSYSLGHQGNIFDLAI